jgi:hypothetical protein
MALIKTKYVVKKPICLQLGINPSVVNRKKQIVQNALRLSCAKLSTDAAALSNPNSSSGNFWHVAVILSRLGAASVLKELAENAPIIAGILVKRHVRRVAPRQ